MAYSIHPTICPKAANLFSKEDLDFIISSLLRYESKFPRFFSTPETLRRIQNGSCRVARLKEGGDNIATIIFSASTAYTGEKYLHIEVMSGRLGSSPRDAIQVLRYFFEALCERESLSFILIDGRTGWYKYLEPLNFKRSLTSYVKHI